MAGVSVSTTAERGKSPYSKRFVGWCGMVLREGTIELRHRMLNLYERLNNLVDWFDSFECVDKAVNKHRGIL